MASRKDQLTIGFMAAVAVALFGLIGFEALRGGKKEAQVQQAVPVASDSTHAAPPKPVVTPAPAIPPGTILNG